MSRQRESKQILRFGVTERVFHWLQALPYLTLLGSGGLMLIQRQMQREFVPTSTLLLIHRTSGVLLPILLVMVFVLGDRRVLVRNALAVLAWPFHGLVHLATSGVSFLIPHSSSAPPGKFNAGQKVHMLLLMLLIPTLLASGLFMWFGHGALLPWYVHVVAFLVAIPLLGGHMFMALIHPVTRKGLSGMFTGRVDARWAREEYGPAPEPVRNRRSRV